MSDSTPGDAVFDRPRVTAILPCNNLDTAEAFFNRLGFSRSQADKARAARDGGEDGYRILMHSNGSDIHLNQAVEGWLIPGKNPFGLYLYVKEIDALAEEFKGEIIERSKKAEHK